jgi:hypothetical protein
MTAFLIALTIYAVLIVINRFLYVALINMDESYAYDDELFTIIFIPAIGTIVLIAIMISEIDFDDQSVFLSRLWTAFRNLFLPKRLRRK